MSEYKEGFGQIQIADGVIAVIAATAAMEVEGVLNTSNVSGNAFIDFFGKKGQTKGVKVAADEGDVAIDIDIAVIFGTKVQAAAFDVQKKIKNAVETMTGLHVTTVNVSVCAIAKEKSGKIIKPEDEQE